MQAIVIRCSVVKVTPACPFANFPFSLFNGLFLRHPQPAHFPLHGVLLKRVDIRHDVRLTNDGITWVPRKLWQKIKDFLPRLDSTRLGSYTLCVNRFSDIRKGRYRKGKRYNLGSLVAHTDWTWWPIRIMSVILDDEHCKLVLSSPPNCPFVSNSVYWTMFVELTFFILRTDQLRW